MRRIVIGLGLTLAASAVAFASEASHHWSYAGPTGPSHWAELDPKFASCGKGKAQSPIDIRTSQAPREALPALTFDYKPGPLHIIDNSHSIQITVQPGSTLRIGGKSYQLVQFHFHHPSEEQIDGRSADMVAHLVHRDSTGKLAVVAVLLDRGNANTLVETLWRHLPKQQEREEAFTGVRINPASLLPADRGYYTYAGSLTTPPCSEDVGWIVLKSHSTLSASEIATFAARYPNDARPVQNLNGREVLASK